MPDINSVSIITFYSLIVILIILFRKKLTISYYISFLYKTRIGLKLMDRIGKRFPRFFRALGYVGVVVGFVGMISMLGLLLFNFIKMMFWPAQADAVIGLVIPGVRIPGNAFFVPFWYGISALFFIILIHEFSHGILSRAHDITVKSTGVGMFLIFPLAFVEPDEKRLSAAPKKRQLSILAAGSFANIIMAFIAILLVSFVFAPLYSSAVDFKGVKVEKTTEGLPADIAGIKEGEVITAVNGIPIDYVDNFTKMMMDTGVNEQVVLSSKTKEYILTTIPNPENKDKPLIGIYVSQHHSIKQDIRERYGSYPEFLYILIKFLTWVQILGLGIGMANLLPLGPLDGGRMLLVSLSKFFKNRTEAMRIWKFISMLCLFLLLANFIIPYFMS